MLVLPMKSSGNTDRIGQFDRGEIWLVNGYDILIDETNSLVLEEIKGLKSWVTFIPNMRTIVV